MKGQISLLGITLCVVLMGCVASTPANGGEGIPLKSGERLPPPPSISSLPKDLGQMLPITAQAQMAGQQIMLEVTRTPQEQAMGLMYRTSLADDRGMLFSFVPARPVSFWMKNTKIPLDMIFMREGTVKAIAQNVPPCTADPCPGYGPQTPIDQVIELRGGRAAELGLQVGDQVSVKFLDENITPPNPTNY